MYLFLTVNNTTRNKNLCILNNSASYRKSETACVANPQIWHERLAHVDPKGIVKMVKHGVVSGIEISDTAAADNCEGCIYGKSTRAVIPNKSDTRAQATLDLIHSDVLGPVEVPSLGGSRYFISFIDDHSKWTTVYPKRNKSDSLAMFKMFHNYAETHTGRKIKLLTSANILRKVLRERKSRLCAPIMAASISQTISKRTSPPTVSTTNSPLHILRSRIGWLRA